MTDAMVQLITLGLLFAGMYFLVIAPQRQKDKDLRKLLSELKKGDKVVTLGGLLGIVEKIDGETVTLRCGSATLELQRGAIQSKLNTEAKA